SNIRMMKTMKKTKNPNEMMMGDKKKMRTTNQGTAMRFENFSFGSIQIDGTTHEHDVVIDRGEIRKRKKKPSKQVRDEFGHTPLSIEETIPWKCRRLVIGTGAYA